MRTILIPAEPSLPLCEIDTEGLDSLQAAVGGYIEALPVPGVQNATAYINEEGKFDSSLPVNHRATLVWAKHELLYPGDYIVGDLIITGLNNDTGEQIPVPADFLPDLPRGRRNPNGDGWIIDAPTTPAEAI